MGSDSKQRAGQRGPKLEFMPRLFGGIVQERNEFEAAAEMVDRLPVGEETLGPLAGPQEGVDRLGDDLRPVEVPGEELDHIAARPVDALTGLGDLAVEFPTAAPALPQVGDLQAERGPEG